MLSCLSFLKSSALINQLDLPWFLSSFDILSYAMPSNIPCTYLAGFACFNSLPLSPVFTACLVWTWTVYQIKDFGISPNLLSWVVIAGTCLFCADIYRQGNEIVVNLESYCLISKLTDMLHRLHKKWIKKINQPTRKHNGCSQVVDSVVVEVFVYQPFSQLGRSPLQVRSHWHMRSSTPTTW